MFKYYRWAYLALIGGGLTACSSIMDWQTKYPDNVVENAIENK
jgi:hypothetical protein